IKNIIDSTSSVSLITRPRRFGKTLNMSMLRYYFDINNKQEAEQMFKGLKIMEQGEEYTSKMGAYPVIYITLKDVNDLNYEKMILDLKTAVMDMYRQHRYLMDSDKIYPEEKDQIMDILYGRENEIALKNSIKALSEYLYRHHGKPVVLLVDEYDVPIQNAYVQGYYEEAIKFYRTFYGQTFKDNPNLIKTVLTGVSRVAKESIFSGANNFTCYTILDNEFSQDFGFTSEEIDKIIEDFEITDQKEEIKKWYDGYRIGNSDNIYNPWSIVNYINKRELKPYWVNTSSNDLIKLVLKNSLSVKEKIEKLLLDEPIEVKINMETIIVGIEEKEENIWGLMLGTGYLKVVEKIKENYYKVLAPNNEIKELFRNIVDDWFSYRVPGKTLDELLSDLINLKTEEFEEKFKILVKEMFSFMDVGENQAENFYHAYVLGLRVGLKDTYHVNSNRESGLGRYDIMLEPFDKTQNSFIMEFKVYKEEKESTIEDTLNNAKKQIEEKQYEQNLRERGFENITKMVFAFKGKDVKMEIYK
ncbi:MAG: AAA family ATPase, partial [Clostridia bacterium]|nr:AAA family ATPase [Clostridia bacterium]